MHYSTSLDVEVEAKLTWLSRKIVLVEMWERDEVSVR